MFCIFYGVAQNASNRFWIINELYIVLFLIYINAVVKLLVKGCGSPTYPMANG